MGTPTSISHKARVQAVMWIKGDKLGLAMWTVRATPQRAFGQELRSRTKQGGWPCDRQEAPCRTPGPGC